jgi:hypothetical protein
MAQVELQLARDRHQSMQTAAALRRDGQRAAIHGRLVRQARRAERRRLSQADEAARLRARLAEIEAGV